MALAQSQTPDTGSPIPWEKSRFLTLKQAGDICGVSSASLYAYQKSGRLEFKRFGGRTLIVTESLLRLLTAAEEWQPSERGSVGRKKRIERARAARRD